MRTSTKFALYFGLAFGFVSGLGTAVLIGDTTTSAMAAAPSQCQAIHVGGNDNYSFAALLEAMPANIHGPMVGDAAPPVPKARPDQIGELIVSLK